jgi:hypothetical protein
VTLEIGWNFGMGLWFAGVGFGRLPVGKMVRVYLSGIFLILANFGQDGFGSLEIPILVLGLILGPL